MQAQTVLPFCSMVFLEAFYLLLCFGWNMFSSCRLIILNLLAFATIHFHSGSLLLCNYVKCEEREPNKFRVYGFSHLCKSWKLQWPLAFGISTCRRNPVQPFCHMLSWNAASGAELPDFEQHVLSMPKLNLSLKHLITPESCRVSRLTLKVFLGILSLKYLNIMLS